MIIKSGKSEWRISPIFWVSHVVRAFTSVNFVAILLEIFTFSIFLPCFYYTKLLGTYKKVGFELGIIIGVVLMSVSTRR